MNKFNLIIRDASKRDVPEMLELIRQYECGIGVGPS
jgi:N-acetylglutamate synthase-like GNAT family acetyltransferase